MNVFDYFKGIKPAQQEDRSISYSISDPALADWLGLSSTTTAGISVNETSSLGLTAVYRSVSIIAGTIASLPLKSYRKVPNDGRERVTSFLDDPGRAVGLTPYEWTELVMIHLLLHGNAYLLHVYNGAGAIAGLQPLHPSSVSVEVDKRGEKVFTISLAEGGTREFGASDLTHIMAMSLDGIRGLSPIQATRNAIGAGLAGDKAAAKMFVNGMLIGGLVSSEEDVTEDEASNILSSLKSHTTGSDRAGDLVFVNRNLKFNPWSMSAEDAQFIESRAFQVEEVARIFGVPKSLLAEDGASTWGNGIMHLIHAMQKFTFMPWTKRIQDRLTVLLPRPRYAEFDYAQLLQPNQTEVTANLKAEIEIGTLTVNEARQLLNRPPLEPQEVEENE